MKPLDRLIILAISIISILIFSGCQEESLQVSKTVPILHRTTMDQSKLLAPDTLSVVQDASAPGVGAVIKVNSADQYQTMDGFGYTLTGGSALHLWRMTEAARKEILKELFSRTSGSIGVNYLRVSIGSSDLDEFPWSYNDLPRGQADELMENFSLSYDTLYLIPTLKEILAINPELKIMGSPWSPPAWMKDNQDTRGGSLRPKYFPSYANYFVKYIQAMAAEGIRIDAITVQNEPLHPGNNPSLLMLAEDQASFIKDHLGPAFRAAGIDTKIIIYDHNADRPDYPISILDDEEAAQYIDGSAFHLYGGPIDTLSAVHKAHPDKNLYFTEQWIGAPANFAEDLSWHIENLMIGAPRNWSKTVLEWNLAADEHQQPHTDRGGCTRCLGAITIIGDSIIRNPAYYIIAHGSKFVPSGSVRIGTNQTEQVLNVAYTSANQETVVLLQNKDTSSAVVQIQRKGESLVMNLEGGEVATLVWPMD
jgi:glucosylceramidase